jgi:3',5'-cyclic AMP phosphodiesterase CpdA
MQIAGVTGPSGSPGTRRARVPLVVLVLAAVSALLAQALPAQAPHALPNRANSVKFAAIGDNGTGDREQYEVGQQMVKSHAAFAFNVVIMLGDNMYGGQSPADFVKKFEQPYAPLLKAGVRFQASLGNHDRPEQINYKPFNMNGQRYYSYVLGNARFFALDTTLMDQKQIAWIDASLREAREEWKICYFHHPLYSNAARHGSSVDLRVLLEPLFVKHGVDVVFAGHDHVYERVKPQKGITHFVSGAGGQLRRGNMRPAGETAAYFDQDRSFMLIEIDGNDMHFQSISRVGKVIDSGVITVQNAAGGEPAQPAGVVR